jgi:primosomal protein N' (replication factor Y)
MIFRLTLDVINTSNIYIPLIVIQTTLILSIAACQNLCNSFDLDYNENMFYYYVWVRSNRYHGREPLTYSSDIKLIPGMIVEVELQKTVVVGFISGAASKPRFKTKPITNVLDLPALPANLVKLCTWLIEYYPAPLGMIAQQVLPANLSIKRIGLEEESNIVEPIAILRPPLTDDQANAIDLMAEANTYLLHGKTGSGKTRVYLELAIKSIETGKSVVVLTPEISLTSQLGRVFREVFGSRVIVVHSKQTPKQRLHTWLMCLRSSEPLIVIGPRSALFMPLDKIGLIVLDEAHEAAYKQDQAPHYLTSRVAGYLSKLTTSKLILGSATPPISDYYLSKEKGRPIIELKTTAKENSHGENKITIVDRKEHDLFTRSPYISQPLIQKIESALSNKEQVLLYLNRRGTARLVLCENCGWQANCPHCDIPLTYHGDKHILICHSCNYHNSAPTSCPECKHPNVIFKSAGTKAIYEEVIKMFPSAKVARFDTDNTKAESFEENYEEVRSGEVDILIGTQLLAKGLDLPYLSVVGIVLADTSLYIPDFSAEERTYQLINQVLGRIGRGHRAGEAVIQTYNPDSRILKYAINSDYQAFYQDEMNNRQQFMFPPFCYLLKLTTRRKSLKSVESSAEKLKEDLMQLGLRIRVEGPAPSFHEHINDNYEWQLVVKATQRSELLKVINHLPSGWFYDIDPVDLL